jgi:hypothetical protein
MLIFILKHACHGKILRFILLWVKKTPLEHFPAAGGTRIF